MRTAAAQNDHASLRSSACDHEDRILSGWGSRAFDESLLSSFERDVQNGEYLSPTAQKCETLAVESEGRGTAGEAAFSNEEPLLVMPVMPARREILVAHQCWEGIVASVQKDVFSAKLFDFNPPHSESMAEIYLAEIDDEDRTLVTPGAVFYWTIGYQDRPSGRQRASIIRFRRLPVWKASDLELACKKADALLARLENG